MTPVYPTSIAMKISARLLLPLLVALASDSVRGDAKLLNVS